MRIQTVLVTLLLATSACAGAQQTGEAKASHSSHLEGDDDEGGGGREDDEEGGGGREDDEGGGGREDDGEGGGGREDDEGGGGREDDEEERDSRPIERLPSGYEAESDECARQGGCIPKEPDEQPMPSDDRPRCGMDRHICDSEGY